jgi:hypothetical protein
MAGEYSVTARSYLRRALAGLDAADLDHLTDLLTRVVEQAPDPALSPATS